MINVSKDYKKSVYAPIRSCKARIKFKILDYKAYKNIKKVSSRAEISRENQLTNNIRIPNLKYATFEKDFFKLDGSFNIPPKRNEGNVEIGWLSENLCDDKYIFSIPEKIELEFETERSSMGITIYFDVLNEEYATDFDIDFYSANNTLISHDSISNNTLIKYELTKGLNKYKKVVISIKKWCREYRRVKIVEIDFGIIKTYEDNKLIKANILEEMNIISDNLPANEVKFTIDNSDKAFNILNPQGFYSYLVEKQEIIPEIGVELENGLTEWIPMGTYYLKDWQSDEGTLTTTFTGRDIIDSLNGEYKKILPEKTNLYYLADRVLNYLNIEHDIDPALKEIYTVAYLTSSNIKEIIQYIAIAGRCAVYQDRITNKLVIKQFKTLDETTSYINFCGYDMFCGMSVPQVDRNFEFKQIDFDNVFSPPKINLDKLVGTVDVILNEYYKESELKDILDSAFNTVAEETIFVTFNNPVYDTDVLFTFDGAGLANVISIYSTGAYINIKGSVNIKAKGYALQTKKTTFTLKDNDVVNGVTLKIDNPLINTPEEAKKVAEWILAESKLRALYEVNWRQNPCLELGDIVIIEDSYGEKKQSRIFKQEFEYEGFLKGKTQTKGGV